MDRFIKYQSKPITRRAYKIKENDVITESGIIGESDAAHRIYFGGSESFIDFVAHETVNVGDYVVYLNETDVYHCNAKVFHERNVVGDES